MNEISGLTLGDGGLARLVAAPASGRQNVGHAPGGPADRFAHWTGNALLDQDRHTPAVEAVFAPSLTFTSDAAFVLTGAHRPRATLAPAARMPARPVPHATVLAARAGDILLLGPATPGLRTCVCLRPGAPPAALVGRARPPFDAVCTTADPGGVLRVTPGPEFASLADPAAFLDRRWRLSPTMSDGGVRLEPLGVPGTTSAAAPVADPPEITSGPVVDGVVQLTPAGPLVLLRQRPTLGGYPRIATVVDVDIDRLAQHAPGDTVRFRVVTPEVATGLYRQREADLQALQRVARGRV